MDEQVGRDGIQHQDTERTIKVAVVRRKPGLQPRRQQPGRQAQQRIAPEPAKSTGKERGQQWRGGTTGPDQIEQRADDRRGGHAGQRQNSAGLRFKRRRRLKRG